MTGELEQSLRNWINSVFKENGMNDSTIPRETSLSNALKDGTSLCRLATALRSSLNDTNHASNRGKRIRYNVNPRGIARLERENLSIFFQTITRDLIISAKECPVTVDDILTGEDEKLITLLQFIRCKTNEKQESNHSNNNNNNTSKTSHSSRRQIKPMKSTPSPSSNSRGPRLTRSQILRMEKVQRRQNDQDYSSSTKESLNQNHPNKKTTTTNKTTASKSRRSTISSSSSSS
eukprot:gb/GECH01008389.1/.p1 GENE.gb/GECH01008389.1/~~gb/GECH01008389.1/.p1  ORF type:complete len:234 (+),score=83.15 gb/GECH01008389.1/:1-702(+)